MFAVVVYLQYCDNHWIFLVHSMIIVETPLRDVR